MELDLHFLLHAFMARNVTTSHFTFLLRKNSCQFCKSTIYTSRTQEFVSEYYFLLKIHIEWSSLIVLTSQRNMPPPKSYIFDERRIFL